MTITKEVEKLFLDTLEKSEIKRVYANGFEKYIIYNKFGTLFVVGFNSQTGKHGFGRTPLMLQEYKKVGLSTSIFPDYRVLYVHVACVHAKYKELSEKLKPIFDFVDMFCGKEK